MALEYLRMVHAFTTQDRSDQNVNGQVRQLAIRMVGYLVNQFPCSDLPQGPFRRTDGPTGLLHARYHIVTCHWSRPEAKSNEIRFHLHSRTAAALLCGTTRRVILVIIDERSRR